MSTTTLQCIKEKYGARASDLPMERCLYSRDLAPVPDIIIKPLFNTLPDIVVRPENAVEVANLISLAGSRLIPVIPRAGATTSFFNTVPVRGGIVMDLNLLNGVTAVDEEGMTVTVRAATTWNDLETYLNRRGLACKSIPSSAPSATIGGWLCMRGYGIGSLKYGSLASQVRSVEAVLPDGSIRKFLRRVDPEFDWLVSSEGTLGIVTEVELEVRRLMPMNHFLIHVPDAQKVLSIMHGLLGIGPVPYSMHFCDQSYLRTMGSLGMSHVDVGSGCIVAVDFEGPARELSLAENRIGELVASEASLTLLPRALAEEEWQERFRAIRLKRGGPSMLGGEVWLPVKNLPRYMADIERIGKRFGIDLITYGHVVSPEHATMMTAFFTDETRLVSYVLDLSLVKKIQDAGYRNGGSPYGVGLWNTPYIGRVHDRETLKRLKARKQSMDPRGIMNPGKVYRAPLVLSALPFHLSMEILAALRRFSRKGW